MIKRLTLALSIALAACGVSQAQVQNHALSLQAGSSVDCGAMPQLNGLETYTMQFWFNPSEWKQGAVLFQRGNEFKVALGAPSELVFTIGNGSLTAKSDAMGAGKWAQITFRANGASGLVRVNGQIAGRCTTVTPIESDEAFVIGGNGYVGRIDEVRIWKCILNNDFENYIYNTLNEHMPEYSDLMVYYKMDQNECEHLVDYCAIDKDLDYNNHGILKGGATKVAVTDNDKMPYLINSAYTANERFYDRYIPAEQYRMSNDIINLGIQSMEDGHLKYSTSCDHGTLKGNAKRLESYEGRNTVLSLDGDSYMEVPKSALENPKSYGFETYVYLEEWIDGAYLLRSENNEGTEGLAIYLDHFQSDRVPDSTPVIVIRVNGKCWRYPDHGLTVGAWHHIGISYIGGNSISTVFTVAVDGKKVKDPRTFYHDGSIDGVPLYTNANSVEIGRGFKAKFDQTVIPKSGNSVSDFQSHMKTGLPMVSLTTQVTSIILQNAGAYYDYDDPENPGFDLYSQDNWLKIMKSAFDGYRGAKFYISVKTPAGYNDQTLPALINKASFRENFATDLAKLSEPYDGVELDLEWVYNWTSYGIMAELIREKLPEGKIFRVSTHNVTYKFPTNKMQFVDGFTFQQYGPQKEHFIFSKFKSYCNAFVNYGYPKDKIMTSYSTTTSESNRKSPIKGVKDGFFDDNYVPQLEEESKTFGNDTYWFTGPLQTYERAKFTRENKFMGIFYWDMGNDVYEPADENGHRAMHKYNLARWSTYAINSNVDRYITKVDVAHYGESGLMDMEAATETALSVVLDGTTLHVCVPGKVLDTVTLCNMAGAEVYRAHLTDGSANLSGVGSGIYILTVQAADGTTYTEKFINK